MLGRYKSGADLPGPTRLSACCTGSLIPGYNTPPRAALWRGAGSLAGSCLPLQPLWLGGSFCSVIIESSSKFRWMRPEVCSIPYTAHTVGRLGKGCLRGGGPGG